MINMNIVIIMLFILLLNVVAIALTYYCLENMEQKEKIIFIAAGVAVIYILTTFVYWISTRDVEMQNVVEQSKNLIIFMFVPINSIFILPILAKSYIKYKIGRLKLDKLRNRCIVLIVFLLLILILESSYFKNIQTEMIRIIESNNKTQEEQVIDTNLTEETNIISSNEISNELTTEIVNDLSNESTNIIEDNKLSEKNITENKSETNN